MGRKTTITNLIKPLYDIARTEKFVMMALTSIKSGKPTSAVLLGIVLQDTNLFGNAMDNIRYGKLTLRMKSVWKQQNLRGHMILSPDFRKGIIPNFK